MINIQDEILKTIELMIGKALSNSNPVKTIASIIKEIKDNKYLVPIEGADYYVKNGTNINCTVGTPVWVHIPGDINNAFIIAKR